MAVAAFPRTLFMTRRQFNDYAADDMKYGDISEARLKGEFNLSNISSTVDPFTLTRLTAFNSPQSRFNGVYGDARRGGTLSPIECARLMFEEMQVTSLPYSFVGPYKHLINQMLRHLQQNTGAPFSDFQLNAAYANKILSDKSRNSTLLAIKATLDALVDYKNGGYPVADMGAFEAAIGDKVLPKFDSLIMDKINGMGITIHDVHATRIDLQRLEVSGNRWRAQVKFMGQDHFGLDTNDIRKTKFNQFQFFKIWFVLQRYNRFGFRPFLTNLEAVVNLEGGHS